MASEPIATNADAVMEVRVAAREDEKSKKQAIQTKPGSATKRGRKTGPEARYARSSTYESRPGVDRAGWRAQPSLRCTAVGYKIATCDLIRFRKSKKAPTRRRP